MDRIDHAMITAAESLLSALPSGGRRHACYPFTGPARSQWSYLPGSRRGIALSELGTAGRKAAHRLMATALSRAAFAQAVTIMAFEEVLDLDEQGRLGRHSSGYHAAIFGSPACQPPRRRAALIPAALIPVVLITASLSQGPPRAL